MQPARTIDDLVRVLAGRRLAVLTGVPAAVLAISLLASFVPAWRAMRANPVEAMRVE